VPNITLDHPDLKRILVIRLDNIGDVVLTSPFLRALRKAYPSSRITLLASPAGAQVVPMLPWVDDCISWRPVWQEVNPLSIHTPSMDDELVSLLKFGHFSAALILTSFAQSPYPPASIAFRADIPIRIGQSKEFGGGLLTQWIRPLPDHIHQAERNLHLLDEVGIPRQGSHLELKIQAYAQSMADQLLAQMGVDLRRPFIVLVPGASCEARRYDPERFTQTVELLAEDESGPPVVILGSQKDVDVMKPMRQVKNHKGRIFTLMGRTSVLEFAGIIRRSKLVICNNSSALHFADAFQIPQVILYSGTEYIEQWAPRASEAAILYRPVACSPCYRFQCPYHKQCLDIQPVEVVTRVHELLQATEELADQPPAAVSLRTGG